MLLLVCGHFLAALLAPVLVRRLGRRALSVLALMPAASFVWTATRTATVADGERVEASVPWVPALDIEIALSMGTLQWLMALVVTGVGTLVVLYSARYFADDEPGLASTASFLVAFAGAMLGLVLAADLLLLYVFWELTTVFSFLLIAHDPGRRASRAAGMQALIVTTVGGLAMLVGFLVIGAGAGSFLIEDVLAAPPTGTTGIVAAGLVLLGAATKSALVPFHFWLPSAMAAPTPVSAYLHAAAMVKAGVYLVALLAPAFAGIPGWRESLLVVGAVTMVVGGWRALRQHDLKLLLAYGTVSQLGLLLVVTGAGTRHAAVAALGMLLAHALFKAALFLVVGAVDHATGTRDLRRLSGLGRTMPVLAVTAVLAAASMAGLPPLLGFVAKESILAALADIAADGDGTGVGPWLGWGVVAAVVAGSALTVAYSVRFVWGAFGTRPDSEPSQPQPLPVAITAPPVVLAGLGLGRGFLGPTLTEVLQPYAERFPPGAHEPKLTLWHGVGLPLWLSLLAIAAGVALFLARDAMAAVQARLSHDLSAERGYRWSMRAVDRSAVEITARTQRGSLAIYLAAILVTLVLIPGTALVVALRDEPVRYVLWDSPAQPLVGAVIVVAALLTTRSRRRLKAVVLAGVTGYGTALLFLIQGAPDLALTQLLAETVTLVLFVLALRRLPEYFTDRPLQRSRYWRMAVGAVVAVAVAGFMLVTSAARTTVPVSNRYAQEAVDFGGGNNIVNVTLVDIRAWDTMGELAVLVAAATGVASLIFVQTRGAAVRRVVDRPLPAGRTSLAKASWLSGGRTLDPDRRSIIFEVVTRLIFHTVVVFSLYLLFSGHNNPGGGFAAGLVTGLALLVRYLAGGRYELDEAAPIDAGVLIGAGLFVATASGLVPLAFGGVVLQSAVVDLHVPLLGDVHLVTSLFFDIGVYLVVVGLMLDLLRTLGSGIDRHLLHHDEQGDMVGGGA